MASTANTSRRGSRTPLCVFSDLDVLVSWPVQRVQHLLPLHPQRFGAVEPTLAFHTAVSFTTNTNWQSTRASRR